MSNTRRILRSRCCASSSRSTPSIRRSCRARRAKREIAEAIAAHLRRIGLDVEMQEVAPGRPNVDRRARGARPGPSLMFCGHLDTVGVEGMTAPFDPVERDGRLYGRGAQDMKGGVAAMIDAARVVAADGPAGRPADRGRRHRRRVRQPRRRRARHALAADGAVVTEPTDLQIAIGHKGFAWFEVETRGRAAHGSRPREGRDAILRMGRVLHALEALDRELQAAPPHPLMGAASLHASIDRGRTRVEQLSGSMRAEDWSGARSRRDRRMVDRANSRRFSRGCAADDASSRPSVDADVRAVRPTRSPRRHALPRALARARDQRGPRLSHIHRA